MLTAKETRTNNNAAKLCGRERINALWLMLLHANQILIESVKRLLGVGSVP